MSSSDRKNGNFVVSSLWRALTNREGRWLLCLDNADNPEIDDVIDAVYRQAESSKKSGWVLVTSRSGNPKIWSRMKTEQIYALQSLPTKDAMVLMWRLVHVKDGNEKSDESVMVDINQLKDSNPLEYSALEQLCGDDSAHSLGGLPLAIVQAGSYIGYEKCTFERYLNLIHKVDSKKKWAKYLEKSKEQITLNESQRSILTTWIVSVELLSSEAYEVLLSLAMLGPDPIPESIVTGIVKRIGDESESVEEKYRELVMKELVHGSSLVYREEIEKGRVFSMHRLVRRFVLADADRSAGKCNSSINAVLQALHDRVGHLLENEGKSFRSLPDEYGYHHREYVIHAAAFIKQCESHGSASSLIDHIPKLLDIYRFTGCGLDFYGMVNEAESIWRGLLLTVLKYKEMNNGACITQRDIALSLISLGIALSSGGKFEESTRMLLVSLEILRAVHGADAVHSDIASLLNNLGSVYYSQGKYDDAESMLKQGLAMLRAIHGKDAVHSKIALTLSNLGSVYRKQSKLNDAESMHEKSLAMNRAIHGKDAVHSNIASSLNNLGLVYFDQGKYDDAESMHKRSLAMKRAIHGKGAVHSGIALSLNNLGMVYYIQGKYNYAESMYKQSLAMNRAIHGKGAVHSDIASSLNNLGMVYYSQGKYDDAESIHVQSLAMNRAIHGKDAVHPDIASSYGSLGLVYEAQGKLDNAESNYLQSLSMLRALFVFDSAHSCVLQTLNHLGRIYEKLEKQEKAEKLYEEANKLGSSSL